MFTYKLIPIKYKEHLMFNLSPSDIHLAAQASNKQQAISLVAAALQQQNFVESDYLQGMLAREEQTSTYLGNGIAIPHGTLETRHLVKKTGVQIFQFPQGIEWSEGNTAYLVIGIAARSDEHLTLLRQLTRLLSDEEITQKLAITTDKNEFITLFNATHNLLLDEDLITLEIDTNSLLTLTAINAGNLQQKSAVDNQFISEVLASPALPIGNDIWVTDSLTGNLKNAIAFARPAQPLLHNGKKIAGLITVSAVDDQINPALSQLLDENCQKTLNTGNRTEILQALKQLQTEQPQTKQPTEQTATTQAATPQEGTLEAIFTIKNEHGLHARPSALLVNEVKKYNATIQVQNLDRQSELVSAKSLMKIVALGVVKGHRLRFVATGEEAQQALAGIGAAIDAGLGE